MYMILLLTRRDLKYNIPIILFRYTYCNYNVFSNFKIKLSTKQMPIFTSCLKPLIIGSSRCLILLDFEGLFDAERRKQNNHDDHDLVKIKLIARIRHFQQYLSLEISDFTEFLWHCRNSRRFWKCQGSWANSSKRGHLNNVLHSTGVGERVLTASHRLHLNFETRISGFGNKKFICNIKIKLLNILCLYCILQFKAIRLKNQ
jgi:hypothetical protein